MTNNKSQSKFFKVKFLLANLHFYWVVFKYMHICKFFYAHRWRLRQTSLLCNSHSCPLCQVYKLWRMNVLIPVENQLFSSQWSPARKEKEILFGDVFLTKVVLGKSMFQIVESELADYKVEETIPLNSNLLLWWKANELKYLILPKLAKWYLCVPATSVASERVFSSAGDLVSAQRSCLRSGHVDNKAVL